MSKFIWISLSMVKLENVINYSSSEKIFSDYKNKEGEYSIAYYGLCNYLNDRDMIINDFTKLDIILQVVSGVIMYIIHEFGDDHEII